MAHSDASAGANSRLRVREWRVSLPAWIRAVVALSALINNSCTAALIRIKCARAALIQIKCARAQTARKTDTRTRTSVATDARPQVTRRNVSPHRFIVRAAYSSRGEPNFIARVRSAPLAGRLQVQLFAEGYAFVSKRAIAPRGAS